MSAAPHRAPGGSCSDFVRQSYFVTGGHQTFAVSPLSVPHKCVADGYYAV